MCPGTEQVVDGNDPHAGPWAYLPVQMEQTECSEASAYKIQTQGNYPEESIQYSKHDESLKSRKYFSLLNILLSYILCLCYKHFG